MPMPIEKLYTAEEFYSLGITEPCELINGQIVYMSPSPNIRHQRLAKGIIVTIENYIKKNKGKCEVFSAPTDVKLSSDVIVVPDIFIACDPNKFDEQKYNGAPDLVMEIVSPGSFGRDYKDKLLLYKAAGVKEYWIIDPTEERVIAYLFGQPNITEFYTFDDVIPVGLYKNNSEPLEICVNKLINN
ncbi:MAG: Uma2 family endonuclease [Ruminococcus sp.]|nr:Uma2 family endonuclease [Ruminococcus sp.]MCM1480935.1 Uma2 family endonuclease [Muribaculaceae bacterium]